MNWLWKWLFPPRKPIRTKLMWIGDGFSLGNDQIGRFVNIDGQTGVVVDGDAFTITVEWD